MSWIICLGISIGVTRWIAWRRREHRPRALRLALPMFHWDGSRAVVPDGVCPRETRWAGLPAEYRGCCNSKRDPSTCPWRGTEHCNGCAPLPTAPRRAPAARMDYIRRYGR